MVNNFIQGIVDLPFCNWHCVTVPPFNPSRCGRSTAPTLSPRRFTFNRSAVTLMNCIFQKGGFVLGLIFFFDVDHSQNSNKTSTRTHTNQNSAAPLATCVRTQLVCKITLASVRVSFASCRRRLLPLVHLVFSLTLINCGCVA